MAYPPVSVLVAGFLLSLSAFGWVFVGGSDWLAWSVNAHPPGECYVTRWGSCWQPDDWRFQALGYWVVALTVGLWAWASGAGQEGQP